MRPHRPTKKLALTITAATGKPYVGYLRKHLLAAHAALRPALAELSLAIVGDARMAALHRQFMGIPGPTDVLTFPLDRDARGRITGGEVVVCVGEARRQAQARQTPVRRELLLYAVHGMLHLCGYDDTTPATYRAMHAKEDELLQAIGVGPVFAPPPARAPAARSTAARSTAAAAPRRRRRGSGV